MDATICDHGLADGGTVELAANVRRIFGRARSVRPFARAGIGLAIVRFSDDDVTGLAIPLHLGGGVRASVSHGRRRRRAGRSCELGFGGFNHGLGLQPQAGLTVTAGAEFVLR